MEQVQISSGREILTSLLFLDTVILDILGTLGTYHPEEVDEFWARTPLENHQRPPASHQSRWHELSAVIP